jgi:Uma2 family endonuclease
MAQEPNTFLTPERYLELDRKAESRSEFYGGEMYPVEAATRQHDRILVNTFHQLKEQFFGQPCQVYTSSMRVRVAPGGPYTYPDIIVVSGLPGFADDKQDILLNPTVIIEVMSQSTEDYDCGGKFVGYRKLASLREYLAVAEYKVYVEHWTRQPDERWVRTRYADREQSIGISSIGCTLGLMEVYDRVQV